MFTIIYFSPTGNTKYIAEQIAQQLNTEEVLALEEIETSKLGNNEQLLLLYPIHGFNPPRTVTRFVKNLPTGLYKNVHLLAVGCNDLFINGAVSTGLRRILKKKEYKVIVDEILVMPITLVIKMPDKYLPDMLLEANKKIEEIVTQISSKTPSRNKIKLGSRLFHAAGKLESPAARLFGLELHAKKDCTKCGICWKRCPEGNIKQGKKGTPTFGFRCSMCLRCIYECPVKAITPRISKFIPIKGGYDPKELYK